MNSSGISFSGGTKVASIVAETNVSRFTLGDDGDNNPEIRSNNSFLHDNVD